MVSSIEQLFEKIKYGSYTQMLISTTYLLNINKGYLQNDQYIA